MDFDRRYATDKVAEEEGVEVRLDDGCTIIVARANNRKFKAEMKRLMRPYRNQERRGTMDDDLRDSMTRKAVSKFVLLGWTGITLKGKKIPYSPEKAEDLMKRSEDFENDVIDAATMMETFKKVDVEEGAKNSEAS
jgi:hypothetical protein